MLHPKLILFPSKLVFEFKWLIKKQIVQVQKGNDFFIPGIRGSAEYFFFMFQREKRKILYIEMLNIIKNQLVNINIYLILPVQRIHKANILNKFQKL